MELSLRDLTQYGGLGADQCDTLLAIHRFVHLAVTAFCLWRLTLLQDQQAPWLGAECMNSTRPLTPLSFQRLHRALTPMKRLFQLGTVFHDPALDGGMVDRPPALLHEFFDMTIAQGIRHIPAHTHQDDILWEMGSFETDRHRLVPP